MASPSTEERKPTRVRTPDPEFDPEIKASIWPTKDGQWAMGNLMFCEKTGGKIPSDVVVTWLDGQGEEYCLRPRPQEDQPPVPAYDPANGPFIDRHFTSAIFQIGCDVFVKVKWAPKGWPKCEGQSMRLVKERAPEVPLPEAIHFWHDKKWDRYFLIQRRVHGPTIDDVWWTLSTRDKSQVSREIANAIHRISAITAPCYQEADGEPTNDRRLLTIESTPEPSPFGMWGPFPGNFPGPFTPIEYREHLLKTSNGVEPPEIGTEFHFFHGDLGPGNAILSGTEIPKSENESHVHVAALIDWEDAGFYPKFWIALFIVHPLGVFNLSLSQEQCRENMGMTGEYATMVSKVLTGLGWPPPSELYRWWCRFINGKNEVLSSARKS